MSAHRPLRSARDLPQFARDLLASVPRSGEGVHNWLFRCALVLHRFRSTEDIVSILEAATLDCGRPVAPREIIDAVENSAALAGQNSVNRATQAWPRLDRAERDAALRSGNRLVDLWEHSPIRLEDARIRTEEIIDSLFPGNSLLCCGKSHSDFATRAREVWRGELQDLQLIVPSPMSAPTGRTHEGHESAHSLANTGPRHFLVLEFDSGDSDEHAAILLHLAARAPLALVVHSGGRGLHGWFYCHGEEENRLKRFMRYAVSLGADPATWTRSQFVRMPDGRRDNGTRQRVFFCNPAVVT